MAKSGNQALSALGQFLVADATVGDAVHRVASLAVTAVEGASFVGVAMLDHRERPSTAVFTDEQAPEIDQAQYEVGRGPCLDAWRTKSTVRLDDLEHVPSEYAEFAQACLEHGIHSTLSLPLVVASDGLGALNFYSPLRAGFVPDAEAVAGEFAVLASAVLANATAYRGALELSEQLHEALRSRAVIEQAKGMLMARSESITEEVAFDLLRRASQRENVKLRDIASRIVQRQPMVEAP